VAKNTIEATYKLKDQMSKELKTITKEMDKFQEEAEENDKATKKWSLSMKQLAAGVGVVAGAIGAVKIVKFGADVAKTANEIDKFSINTEISTEKISSLFAAVNRGGGDIDSVGDIVQDFTEKLGDARAGSESYKETFKALGVDINQTTDGAFTDAIKSLSEMDDQSKAMFRGIELFGDQYKVVAAQIAEGNNVLEGSPMFSGEFVDSSAEIVANFREMSSEIKMTTNEAL
jgi:methyl-accepting chemotaxis protein